MAEKTKRKPFLSETARNNIKTHAVGTRNVLLCYVLGVILSWAAFPIIVMVLAGIWTPDVCLSGYSIFATVVLVIITYVIMHGYGEKDRKPYLHAKYNLKGLAVAAIAFVIIYGVGAAVIAIANEYIVVHHPQIVIETINAYVRMIIYMPFYWMFRLFEGPAGEICPVPSVTYLNSLAASVFVLAPSFFGYIMGFNGKRIFRGKIKEGALSDFIYQKPKRVRREDRRRKKEAAKNARNLTNKTDNR